VVNVTPPVMHSKQGRRLTGEKLADGEVSSDEMSSGVLPITTRIYRIGWLAKELTEASSTVAMVDDGGAWQHHCRLWQCRACLSSVEALVDPKEARVRV
jgi:hypothetical protein